MKCFFYFIICLF